MKSPILLLGLSFIVGCASPKDVTNAKIRFSFGTNELFSIEQPKDTQIGRAEYRRPDGSVLIIEDYQSTGNAAAIEAVKAQAQAQRDVSIQAMQMVGEAKDQVARAYGIPTSAGATRSVPSPASALPGAPAGFKWIIGADGIPRIQAVDDPSQPALEIDEP